MSRLRVGRKGESREEEPEEDRVSGGDERCANCGAPVGDRYCPACGQEARDLNRSVANLLQEIADGVFSFDSRLWHTLVPLFVRPGELTARYLGGERVRFVPPVRLYLFVSLVYFLMAAWAGPDTVFFAGEVPDEEVAATVAAARDDVPELLQPFVEGAERAAADPEGFRRTVIQGVSYLMFFFVPLFGGLLHLLYLRRGGYYLHHLIFAAHLHVFVYLVLMVRMLLNRSGVGFLEGLTTLVPWVVVLYLFLALRRVYGGRLWATLLRTIVLALTYTTALSLALAGLVMFLLAS